VLPAFVAVLILHRSGKRSPAWSDWSAKRKHAGFGGHFVGLASIADDARSHQIVPAALASFISGNDVIKVQFLGVEKHAAVLAGEFIALKNVLPGEFDLLFRQAVVVTQDDDPGQLQDEFHGMQKVVAIVIATAGECLAGLREIDPRFDVVRIELLILIRLHDLCVPNEQQGDRPAGRAGVDRLPKSVKHKHGHVQQTFHIGKICERLVISSRASIKIGSG
jgi:hypothetical protein